MQDELIVDIRNKLAEDNIMTKNDYLVSKFELIDKKFELIDKRFEELKADRKHSDKVIKWILIGTGALISFTFNNFELIRNILNQF